MRAALFFVFTFAFCLLLRLRVGLAHRADDVAAARPEVEADAARADVNLAILGGGRAPERAFRAVCDDVLRVNLARHARALRRHLVSRVGREYATAPLVRQGLQALLAAAHLALGLLAPASERRVEGDAGVDVVRVDAAAAAHTGRSRRVEADGRLIRHGLRRAGLLRRGLPPGLISLRARDGGVADDVQSRLRGDQLLHGVLVLRGTRGVYAVGDEDEVAVADRLLREHLDGALDGAREVRAFAGGELALDGADGLRLVRRPALQGVRAVAVLEDGDAVALVQVAENRERDLARRVGAKRGV